MKNSSLLIACCLSLLVYRGLGQNSTFSPYSRYGLGELTPPTFAHNTGMGGAHIALRPDSTMPIFINAGNPAAYSLIRLTSLEVGGSFRYSDLRSSTSGVKKWGTNFAYGALGFPVRGNGGACFGIMPYSYVGYDTETTGAESGIGDVNYKYSGTGGLNKAFIGYGIAPFNKRLVRLRRRHLNIPDTMRTLSQGQYRAREFGAKLLSDFSLGVNVNYLFGNIENTTKVIYPNSLLYNNTYRSRTMTLGDFTGNFGAQTAITIDSVRAEPGKRRALKEKVKFTFGYFMGLNNTIKTNYEALTLNYILNGSGQEVVRDTVLYQSGRAGTITLPLEQGFGIGFKKGERLNLVADFAITNWQNFKTLEVITGLKDNYRVSAGANFVPEKYAAGRGSFSRKINYRFGVSYQTGYVNIRNTLVSDYAVSVGVGLPVGIGRLSSMINISGQYGQSGTLVNGLAKENYWRVNFGFTFSDRWFQKFRYD